MHRTVLPVAAVAAVAAVVTGSVLPTATAAAAAPVQIQILAINDLHGRIGLTEGRESRQVVGPGSDGVFGGAKGEQDDQVSTVGGAMNLAAIVRHRQADFRQAAGGQAASFLVGAGDLVGASPPPSSEYKDEPTIEVLNAMGMNVAGAGDDEFGVGSTELLRRSAATDGRAADDVTACEGITKGKDGCFGQGKHAFTGAQFPYLAANVVSRATGELVLPPYQVLYTPLGQKIGFIGVVTDRAPDLVPAGSVDDLKFLGEAESINQYVPQLRSQGVEAIVVLMHKGGQADTADPNGCDGLEGPVLDENALIDPAVDLVIAGHSHGAYVCQLEVPGGEPRLVTEAAAYGKLVTDIRLTLDPASGDVDRSATYTAENVPVTRSTPDAEVQAIVDDWTAGPGKEAASEKGPVLDNSASTKSAARGNLSGAIALVAAVVLPLGAWLVLRRRRS